MEMNIARFDSLNKPLLAGFVCLSFLDIFTTMIAMQFPSFYELNRVASQFFGMGGAGLALAFLVKLLPLPAMFYFVLDGSRTHPLMTRIGKISVTVALVYGNLFYFYVVALNNVPTLVRFFIS